MLRGNTADQRVGAGDHDAATQPEQKQKQYDAAETRRPRQREERDGNQRQPEDKANLVALVIEQRTHADRGHHQTQRLHEGDGSVLRRRQMKPVRQVGQDGAQHGGDQSIDEDSEDSGKDQHAAESFRDRRQAYTLTR